MPLRSDHRSAQLALAFGHTPSLAEDDFLVGEGNELAFAHITAWPNWPGPLTLLIGPAASGKSHLARIWAERSAAESIGPRSVESRGRKAGTNPLVVEDVDRLAYDETELFHLLNQSMRDRRSLLLTARTAISSWRYRTDDLLSRARLASLFEVSLSDDIQLSQMLVKLFEDRQVGVDPKVIAYLVARMERSQEEAVDLVGVMDRLALEQGTAITRAIAAEALAQRLAGRDDSQLELDLESTDE